MPRAPNGPGQRRPVTRCKKVSERAAAFFDLDKTILAKSSSLAFAKPRTTAG